MKKLFTLIKWRILTKKLPYSCSYSFRGGLGNQMFQYAFALAHQKYSMQKGFADLSDYEGCDNHNGWEVEDVFELPDKLPTVPKETAKKFRRLCRELGLRIKEGRESYYKQSSFYPKEGYWVGYWQSYKYFENAEKIIRNNLIFKHKEQLNSHTFVEKIQQSESISIHIRRGDYLTKNNASNFGGICTEAYYDKAIELAKSKIPNAQFFVFSDDKDWCLNQFNSDNFTIIEGFSGKDSWKDMYLMSLCKHSIIANSSFSWWGMFLGDQTSRLVIGPNKFMHESISLTKIEDFLPDSAFRINHKGVIEHSPTI